MNKIFIYFILIFFISSCKSPEQEKSVSTENKEVEETNILINKDKNTIKERFLPPKDFEWIPEQPESFGFFIEDFPMKKYGSPILKYDGNPIATQNLHEAVFDIDTGSLDLQQCADAVIRLHAEYLYKNKRFNEIKYHFTSGDLLSWNDYKNGTRAFVSGNSVSFRKTASADDSYKNFRTYLDLIYTYAGTISLTNYETKPVTKNRKFKNRKYFDNAWKSWSCCFYSGCRKK